MKKTKLADYFRGNILLIVGSLFLCVTFVTSCTPNERAKNFGGTATYTLPKGQKLINVTWKEDNLWYLTREMKEGEEPEIYTLQEESSFGIMEGKVIIQETK